MSDPNSRTVSTLVQCLETLYITCYIDVDHNIDMNDFQTHTCAPLSSL